MKFLITFSIVIISVVAFAQKTNYTLRMPKPQNHYFEVEMNISEGKQNEILIKMPVWAPGSYLVREFAKNVDLVKAKDDKNNTLKVEKINKNTWKIFNTKGKKVQVNYEVYAFELSVRTSFLDLSHGFVSGTSIFMYVDGQKEKNGDLTVIPYKDFKRVSTALKPKSEQKTGDQWQYSFENYDQLVDCPIEIGNQEVFDFTAANVKHSVALYGPGNYDIPTLKKDMSKIVEAATQVFGENPNKEYTFIIHNVVDGQGGLEHTNSTTLSVNRWTYAGKAYIGFLSLVAHEYFHLWNVKRIRPIELGPFNYDEENYTSLLWVMEGFTSYYDELLLRRAGYYSNEEILAKINSGLNYVEGSVGTRVQPVAHASFDAWIKAYRPNENSSNTTMTYYSRGAMLACLLDAKIIKKFEGKKSLDDFMQVLYNEYYKNKKRGFTEIEFKATLNKFIGEDLSAFFEDYVDGTKTPNFDLFFNPIGVKVTYTGKTNPSFGASFSTQNGKVIVKAIRSNSTAEDGGLSVNDEIIGINGYRVSQQDIESLLSNTNPNELFSVLVARDDLLLELNFGMKNYERPSYMLDIFDPSNPLLTYWLR